MTINLNNCIIYYIYGVDGIAGFKYDKTEYLYRKNIQGDITHIYTVNGELVAQYVYDAWGNCKVLTSAGKMDDNSESIGNKNPFRYRSYYFDVDTKLYYLQTRYYDPTTCRFISADSIEYLDPETLGGLNLYAYCNNNPIANYDPNGTFALIAMLIAGLVFGAAIGFAFDVGGQLVQNGFDFGSIDWAKAVNSAIVGGALGLCTALGVGFLGPVIAGTVTGLSAVVSVTSGLVAAAVASFTGGYVGYVVEKTMKGEEVYKDEAIMQGSITMASGFYNFVIGGFVGSQGNVGTKGPLFSTEWIAKQFYAFLFTFGLKFATDTIRRWRINGTK